MSERELSIIVKRILESRNLGVLGTLDKVGPYQSLVAFVSSKDLKSLVFSTATNTRKYTNFKTCPQVSFLIDTRSNSEKDFHECIVITAFGKVKEVRKEVKNSTLSLYLSKHPLLEDFVKSPSCALFEIHVKKYLVVTEFQKVVELKV
ncbi:pyridoxamine 5'-phosphate oxidase family protein [Acidobacteriota bacterium]